MFFFYFSHLGKIVFFLFFLYTPVSLSQKLHHLGKKIGHFLNSEIGFFFLNKKIRVHFQLKRSYLLTTFKLHEGRPYCGITYFLSKIVFFKDISLRCYIANCILRPQRFPSEEKHKKQKATHPRKWMIFWLLSRSATCRRRVDRLSLNKQDLTSHWLFNKPCKFPPAKRINNCLKNTLISRFLQIKQEILPDTLN